MAAICGGRETTERLIQDILAATLVFADSIQKDLPKGFPRRVLD